MNMEKVIGLKVVVRVSGFHDARAWIHRLVSAGVAECASCDKPATHVYWQDQAEWYCFCEDHREHGGQWSGSTRWNPTVFSKTVIPDKAREWVAALSPDDRKNIRLREFDATDYYDLLPDDSWKNKDRVLLNGTEESGTFINLYALTNGEYAYEIETRSPSYGYTRALKGAWPTRQEALDAAKVEYQS